MTLRSSSIPGSSPGTLVIKMTKTTDTELGEDLKKLESHPDIHNVSNTKLDELDDNTLYLIEKHIGYYEPEKKSGIFMLSIKEITDEMIMGML